MAELVNNCLSLQALGESVRSSLGPSTSIKAYIDESSGDDELLLNTLHMVEALTSAEGGHSTNQILYESCQGQQKECGCGVTTLVCLSGLWAGGVVKLTQEQGVPLPVVLALYNEGLRSCDPLFTSCAVAMETGRSHDPFQRLGKVKTFSRHLSSTRPTSTSQNQLRAGLAHGRDEAMRLVADAIELLPGGGLGSSSVLTHCVVGKGQSSSRVVRGVLVDVQSDMTSTITSQQLCVVVIDGDCTPTSTHPGLSRTQTSHDLLYEHQTPSDWLMQCATLLEKYNVGLVVVGGMMSPLLWEHCLATRVVVLTGVRQEQREAISHMSGAVSTCYLQYTKEVHIGRGVWAELVEGGWVWPRYTGTSRRRPIKTYSCRITCTHSAVVTAMLCSSTESTVDLLSQQFSNCLHRVKCAFSDGCVLPGGGVFEAACVRRLRESVTNGNPPPCDDNGWMFDTCLLRHWRPAVYTALAEGLMQYIVCVLRNVDSSLDVYSGRCEAERMVCGRCDCVGVWDDPQSKKGAWSRALSLLATVCSTERTQSR